MKSAHHLELAAETEEVDSQHCVQLSERGSGRTRG